MKSSIVAVLGALAISCGGTFVPAAQVHTVVSPSASFARYRTFSVGLTERPPAGAQLSERSLEVQSRLRPFIVSALVGLVSLAGLLVPSGPVLVVAAGLIGFAAAFILILTLALPPLLVLHDDVHRLAAGMLALGYSTTFIVPYLSGAVWDATHITEAALLPGVLGALIVVAMASTFRLERKR